MHPSGPAASYIGRVQVRVLGDLEVEVAGGLADLGGPKPRALLSLLVAAAGRPVPIEQLIDQMWGEDPPARVEASLQSYVARLRRALEPARAAGAQAQRLRTHAAGYSLALEADAVDARRFTTLLHDARGAPSAEATELLTAAVALWRGEPYAGLDTPTLRAEATRLRELRTAALVGLWELRLARGEHAEAVAELEHLVGLHPHQERLWGLLALAHYRSRRQGDALATLRRARDHLAEELGVDPGPELRELEVQVLRQDPALDAAPRSTAAPAGGDEAGVLTARDHLVGRTAALAAAADALAGAASGRGRLVLVTGEPGIGKTRLAEAVAQRARTEGFRVGRGGWDADGSPPLSAWSRALGQALGHEALGVDGDGDGVDAASVSFRQADAVLAALTGGPPVLLVLDDLHWADTESLRLLRRLASGLAEVPAVIVATSRVAAADIGEPLAEALAVLARLEPVRIDLHGLDARATADWVTGRAGRHVRAEVAEELVRRTDGNPFYLTELVRLLVSEGALDDPSAPAWQAVPGGVRDVVRQRSRQLAERALEVLAVAAVCGRSFELAVLDEVTSEPAAVEAAVEGAQVLGLVDEAGPGRCRFTHALVRDALYEALPAPRRARLHAEVAAALELSRAGRVGEVAAELAEHYRLAGPAHARSGWVLARRAAAEAADRSAYDESLRLATLAGDLQALDPTADDREREGVLVARAHALTRVGRPVDAWSPAEQAARSALGRGDRDAAATALLTVTEAMVWGWRRHPDYDDDAIALWRRVRDLHTADDPSEAGSWALLTAAMAAEHLHRPNSSEESTRLADEASAVVHRTGTGGRRELLALRLAHMALLRPELLHHRLPLSDEIVDLAARVGQPHDLAGALTARAQDRGELGRLEAAHSDVVRAHELAERHHLSQNRVVSGWCLAQRLALEGRLEQSERAIVDNDAFQATLAMSGYGIGLCQLALLRDLQGRMAELEPTLREVRHLHPGLREVHALSLARAGRHDELRVLLGEWREQPQLLRDYLWVLLTAVRAEVWSGLGDRAAARDLGEQLAPYADRLAFSAPVGFRGSVQQPLGLLAAATGDVATAREHLLAARARHEQLGLAHWVKRTDVVLSRL